jgi:hypothetical protein
MQAAIGELENAQSSLDESVRETKLLYYWRRRDFEEMLSNAIKFSERWTRSDALRQKWSEWLSDLRRSQRVTQERISSSPQTENEPNSAELVAERVTYDGEHRLRIYLPMVPRTDPRTSMLRMIVGLAVPLRITSSDYSEEQTRPNRLNRIDNPGIHADSTTDHGRSSVGGWSRWFHNPPRMKGLRTSPASNATKTSSPN